MTEVELVFNVACTVDPPEYTLNRSDGESIRAPDKYMGSPGKQSFNWWKLLRRREIYQNGMGIHLSNVIREFAMARYKYLSVFEVDRSYMVIYKQKIFFTRFQGFYLPNCTRCVPTPPPINDGSEIIVDLMFVDVTIPWHDLALSAYPPMIFVLPVV